MKFREHRGSLEHSMQTVVEIGNTFTDVCKHARSVLTSIGLEPGESLLPTPIRLMPFSDTRIEWEGFLVTIVGWGVVGYIDDVPLDTPPDVFTEVARVVANDIRDTSLVDSMYPNRAVEVNTPTGLAAEEGTVINEILDNAVVNLGTYTGADFFQAVKDAIAEGRADEVVAMIDSLPPELQAMKEVRKGTVVVPDAEHMTEAMVDASRGLHLYYMDTGAGSVSSPKMRKHLRMYAPWSEKHWPKWFADDGDHLTKAGRAIVAHALTIGAYQDPEARSQYLQVETTRKTRIWDNPIHQRIRLTFNPCIMGESFSEGGFVIHVPFINAHPVDTDDAIQRGVSRYELRLNRSDIPKAFRGQFKTDAVFVELELSVKDQSVDFRSIALKTKLASNTFDVVPAMASRW